MSRREARRAARGATLSKRIHDAGQHDALLDILNGILNAKGDGPQKRLAIGKPYFDAPRRTVAVEATGDRVVVYLEGEGAPDPSLWVRFVTWLRILFS